jgi:hypothetical protein
VHNVVERVRVRDCVCLQACAWKERHELEPWGPAEQGSQARPHAPPPPGGRQGAAASTRARTLADPRPRPPPATRPRRAAPAASPDGRGRALLIGGGIANFTDVAATFKGIITALREQARF